MSCTNVQDTEVADETGPSTDDPSIREAATPMPLDVDSWYLMCDYNVDDLLKELAETHTELAHLHQEIAFNKVAEIDNKLLKSQRLQDEGLRDALVEKKFLIIRLLDARQP